MLSPHKKAPNSNENDSPSKDSKNKSSSGKFPSNIPNILQLSRPLYSPLEYKLRVALNSVSATVVRAFAVKTQQQTEEWMEDVVRDRAIVEAWIDVSQLSGENSIQRIVERGIHVPEYGVRISCGSIQLEPREEDSLSLKLGTQLQDPPKKSYKPKKVYKLLHVWACIGRPFVTEAREGEIVIPHGYDSVYLQSVQPSYVDDDEEENIHTNEYHHKYIIYDSNKLFADYLVYLEYSPDGDSMLRESLNQRDGGIDLNSSRRHSVASFRSHMNNDIIEEAYNKILHHLEEKDKELVDDQMPVIMESDEQTERIDIAKEMLETIEQRRAQICENAIEVESELREQFKLSLCKLHDITQLKLSKLCSLEVEITRRIQEMQWMNEFIQYQRPILDPLSFVESYSHHATIKENKVQELDNPLHQAEISVQDIRPDIQCTGKLSVSSDTERITEQMMKQRQVVVINPPSKDRKDLNGSPHEDSKEDKQHDDCKVS